MEQNEKVESNQYDGRGGFWLLDIPQSESADAQNRRSVRQTPLFSSAGEGAERRVRALQHRFDVGGKSREAVDEVADLGRGDAVLDCQRENMDQLFAGMPEEVCAEDAIRLFVDQHL